MSEKNNEEDNKRQDKKIFPKSPITRNTLKDFAKICRAYYNEVMHIATKDSKPNISKTDLMVLDNLLSEVLLYSEDLINRNYILEAKSIIEIGLVISDFVLKIFGSIPEIKGKSKNNLGAKLEYPLTKKLILLQSNFNILLKYERNYEDSEKNIEEIIEIQQILNSPPVELANSYYLLAISDLYLKKLIKSEKNANKALELLEGKEEDNNIEEIVNTEKSKNQGSNKTEENKKSKENTINENIKTNRIASILEFLGDLYKIMGNYSKAQPCLEKAYYLNLGKFGAQNINTNYYKAKLEEFKKEAKEDTSNGSPMKTQDLSHSGNKSSMQNSFQNMSNTFNKTMPLKSNSKWNNFSPSKSATSIKNNSMNKTTVPLSANTLHKGKAGTFSFKIPTSNFYEPMLISIYALGNDFDLYSSELFLKNLCFDKLKLLVYLNETTRDNSLFYTDDSLNIILGNIYVDDRGKISFMDEDLKRCLISNI